MIRSHAEHDNRKMRKDNAQKWSMIHKVSSI
ncbi:unnamed protein product [Wuchereria bancrofti]|uniref:Uncharacterized protein n=1 Tax=Wuchereria bancrofti TaxID=6293 RepID=A0A3P7DRI4_WUCBA|nr:unnamed protein product [Wuchereria bancrofti]